MRAGLHRRVQIMYLQPARAGQAPPLRYDETRDSSEITTLPLISRLRRQLPPEGKPFGCGGAGRPIVYAS